MPNADGGKWWDNKPVCFLSTGASGCEFSVGRIKRGIVERVPFPSVLADYYRLMGGVDRDDQLRLQRYSMQLQNRYRKYYKSIFWRLLDLVVVNGYVAHREWAKRSGEKSMLRAE